STEQNLMAPGADGFLNIAANALRACVNAARGPRRCGAPGACAVMHVDRTCGPDLWAGFAAVSANLPDSFAVPPHPPVGLRILPSSSAGEMNGASRCGYGLHSLHSRLRPRQSLLVRARARRNMRRSSTRIAR